MQFFKNLSKDQIAIQIFEFCRSIIAGLVLMGVNSSFLGMLYENGINLKNMSLIPIATAPYSLKVLISPYIKNLICVKNFNLTKLVYITQIVILILFSTLGYNTYSMFWATLNIFLLTSSISVYDIISTHIKLTNFKDNQFGLVTAFNTIGFRIGMLIGGGGLAYIAYYFGWHSAFISSACVLIGLNMILTPKFINICENTMSKNSNVSSAKQLFLLIRDFMFSGGAIGLVILILSVKIPDVALHTTKQVFLLYKNFNKIEIANISQIPGVFAMILGGIIGGILTCKYSISKCMKLSLISFGISCGLFLYLSYTNLGLWLTGMILTISSLSCGFLNVSFRTFVDKFSQKDVNKNVLLLSIGSLFKLIFGSASLLIANNNQWGILYALCVLSTIPGLIICYKSKWLKQLN